MTSVTLTDVTFDLEGHELARLSAVLTASADNLSLVSMHASECAARWMLYNNLDPEQRCVYQQLTEAGILSDLPGSGG